MAITSKPLSIANVVNGKSPFTHYAWSWSQLGTDRFTQLYPNENIFPYSKFTDTNGWVYTTGYTVSNNEATINKPASTSGRTFFTASPTSDVKFELGKTYSLQMDIFIGDDVVNLAGSNVFMRTHIASNGSPNDFGAFDIRDLPKGQWSTVKIEGKTPNGGSDLTLGIQVSVGLNATMTGTIKVRKPKLEQSNTCTIYTPAPSEDPTNAYPLYQGIYTDNNVEGSTNPQKYAWQRIKGENGQDGENGQNAPYVTAVQVQYAQSLDGVTPPTSGWVNDKPTPSIGYWQWQRVRDVFSNGTYGMWVATSVYYGRDAIIVSATEPNPKVDNMLWQKPSDPTVLRWNGSAWVEWGISVDNLVVDNATIKNGVFQTIEGVEIKAGTFINQFKYNPYPNGDAYKEGTTTIANGKWVTEYQHVGSKEAGIVDYTGTAILNDEALQFTRTMVAGNSENSFMQLSALGLTINYGGRGGTLGYNDLYSRPKTSLTAASGFEQYNTSPTSGNHPTAQRTGRLVQLAGAFKPTKDYPGGDANVLMCTLPVGFRPISSVNQIVQATGANMYLLSIQTNGQVLMTRHRGNVSGTFDYKVLTTGAWCNIACTFAAADL